jgi:DNA-binding MarR family transcriptional regulator
MMTSCQQIKKLTFFSYFIGHLYLISTARLKSPVEAQSRRDPHEWTFLTNHAHVLVCIAGDPNARVRDIAARVGITERAVARILFDLEDAGYIVRTRDGRRRLSYPFLPAAAPFFRTMQCVIPAKLLLLF